MSYALVKQLLGCVAILEAISSAYVCYGAFNLEGSGTGQRLPNLSSVVEILRSASIIGRESMGRASIFTSVSIAQPPAQAHLQQGQVAKLLLIARYLPATLGHELRNTLVDIRACGHNLVL